MVLELKAGIRLPAPDHCPRPIENLMINCFRELPLDRPSFEKIKEYVSIAYNDVTKFYNNNKLNTIHEQPEVDYTDLGMEEQYLDMRTQNKNFKELHKPGVNDNKLIRFDSRRSRASFKKEELLYASLQNMNTGIAESTPLDVSPFKNLSHQNMSIKKGSFGSILSPGYKRFFSYSDIEGPIKLALNEQKICPGLTAAKSYPNPYYMMSLASIDVRNPSNDCSDK